MLPPKNRLKKQKEIEEVFKKGKTSKTDLLILKKNRNRLRETRFCFIINLAAPKRITERNKLKRRLREIVRKKIGEIQKGWDIILMTLPGLEKMNQKNAEESIEKIFLKANILLC